MTKSTHERWVQPRYSEQAVGRGTEDSVLGDVHVVLVEAQLQRDRQSGPTAQLFGFAEPAAHHQLGRLFGPVTLEESTLEGTLRLADEGLSSLMSVSSLNQRSAITAWT